MDMKKGNDNSSLPLLFLFLVNFVGYVAFTVALFQVCQLALTVYWFPRSVLLLPVDGS